MTGGTTVEHVTEVDDALRAGLLDCWVDVTDAGGAVGFVPPADRDAVAASLDRALAELADGRRHLVVAHASDPAEPRVRGFGFLAPQTGPVVGHRATMLALQVHPAAQGQGLGRALVEALHEVGRAHGTTQVTLWYRSGLGLGRFYRSVGYREVGRWPRTLRVADDDWRDDVWMATDL